MKITITRSRHMPLRARLRSWLVFGHESYDPGPVYDSLGTKFDWVGTRHTFAVGPFVAYWGDW